MPFGGLLTTGLISAGTSLFSGILGSDAANNAADTQAAAEQKVLDLTNSTVPKANDLISGGVTDANNKLNSTYQTDAGLLQPYQASGTNALSQLNGLVNGGGFKAPTAAEAAATPGYQFQLQQGLQSLDRSAASRGEALGGGQIKAAQQYGQGLASTSYNNTYNQALGTYQTNFGNLQSLANLGLNATNTGVNANNLTGSQAASNTTQGASQQAQNLLSGLGISADALTGQANARASGYVGSANAYGGALNNLGSTATNLYTATKLDTLNKLLNGQG